MIVCRTKIELQPLVQEWKALSHTVGLVPTMGALHEGHLALVRRARATCHKTIATIFVNPTQFAPHEDLDAYPRPEAQDLRALEGEGVDAVYLPAASEIYPSHFGTFIEVQGITSITDVLCGKSRPTFFRGVTTIVGKLFHQTEATHAFFGEKDYQQLQVIRQMVRDLDFPINVVGCPTVREPDGLALSSRNAYLTPEERKIAPRLFETLQNVAIQIREGQNVENALEAARAHLLHQGFGSIDYLDYREGETFEALKTFQEGGRLFAALFLGNTRLIDNLSV